jgi:methylase of polypeptide subunit release factors
MSERASPARPELRDIFGWSRSFTPGDIDAHLLADMRAAGCVVESGGRLKSTVRVSTIHDRFFLHSAFPADAADAVFLGPDSYRFADFLAQALAADARVKSVLEIGAGAGVGGLIVAKYASPETVILTDVNPKALRLAAVNAAHAGVAAVVREASGLEGAPHDLDLIVANPPYVAGESGRTYKDGGGLHGAQLALKWVEAGMAHLAPCGRFLLYTGSAILDGGADQVEVELKKLVEAGDFELRYRELDPDVFPSELRRAAYDDVERIAAVGAVITRLA